MTSTLEELPHHKLVTEMPDWRRKVDNVPVYYPAEFTISFTLHMMHEPLEHEIAFAKRAAEEQFVAEQCRGRKTQSDKLYVTSRGWTRHGHSWHNEVSVWIPTKGSPELV